MRYPRFVKPSQCLTGENAAIGMPPGSELKARDLGGVLNAGRSDEGERHGRRAYGVDDDAGQEIGDRRRG